jgi:hypothetical protein
MKLEILSFRGRFDILFEIRISGGDELRYIMVYGKSQLIILKDLFIWIDVNF